MSGSAIPARDTTRGEVARCLGKLDRRFSDMRDKRCCGSMQEGRDAAALWGGHTRKNGACVRALKHTVLGAGRNKEHRRGEKENRGDKKYGLGQVRRHFLMRSG